MNAQTQTQPPPSRLDRVEELIAQLVCMFNEEQSPAERVILHAEIMDLRELRGRLSNDN